MVAKRGILVEDVRMATAPRKTSALARTLIDVSESLSDGVDRLSFGPPVHTVYNPLSYARRPHQAYLRRARPRIDALLLGMNPGPWGMAQTGVPFGEVDHVRSFLGIDEAVSRPKVEHPKRPIEGFACARSEVSGRRLWSWVAARFGHADAFFERFFIWNDCPLAFMEESGRNRTPDKLPAEERAPLFALCDASLRSMVEALQPKMLIGVGVHARKRLEKTFASEIDAGVGIGTILHPSPASPAANRDWAGTVDGQMSTLGLLEPVVD